METQGSQAQRSAAWVIDVLSRAVAGLVAPLPCFTAAERAASAQQEQHRSATVVLQPLAMPQTLHAWDPRLIPRLIRAAAMHLSDQAGTSSSLYQRPSEGSIWQSNCISCCV